MEFKRTKLSDEQVKRERKMAWIFRSIYAIAVMLVRIIAIAYLAAKLSIYLEPIIGIPCVFIIEQAAYGVVRKNFIEFYLRGEEDELISPEVQHVPSLIGSIIEAMNCIEQIKY